MGTTVEAPQPTAQEIALQQAQLDSIARQNAETTALKPILYKEMGLREIAGQLTPEQLSRKSAIEAEIAKLSQPTSGTGFPTGGLTSTKIKALQQELAGIRPSGPTLEEIPWEERLASMSPQERAGYELNDLYLQRQKDALEGKLPVSPALEAELAQQQADIESNLSRKLGANWRQSTPGIQAMGDFNKRAELLREETRRGQISTGEGLLGSRMGLLQGQQAQQYQQGQNWGLPAFSTLQGAYSQAYQPYQFNRNMQFQANQQSAANRMGLISGAMGAIGMGAGMYYGGKK